MTQSQSPPFLGHRFLEWVGALCLLGAYPVLMAGIRIPRSPRAAVQGRQVPSGRQVHSISVGKTGS